MRNTSWWLPVFDELRNSLTESVVAGSLTKTGGPYLAKNERDMGHPSFVRERGADPCETAFVSRVFAQTLKPVFFADIVLRS